MLPIISLNLSWDILVTCSVQQEIKYRNSAHAPTIQLSLFTVNMNE